MSLFPFLSNIGVNLLPRDGDVVCYGIVFSEEETDRFYKLLFNQVNWQNDVVQLFGKQIVTKRKVAWYGDLPFEYTYSKVTKQATIWTPELLEIKERIESQTGASYNSCLLNLYHNGLEGMGWHSDDEKELFPNGSIASLSFGAARKFEFKHKREPLKVGLILESGCLLEMKGATQLNWLHQLPKSKKILEPRINLTFRTILIPK